MISVWLSVDPLAADFPSWTPYHFVHGNPTNMIDPDGRSADWVESADGNIYWDENATSQETTKEGETYLGKTGVSFNSQTGNRVYHRPDGTSQEFSQELQAVEVNGGRMSESARNMAGARELGMYETQARVADIIVFPIDFAGGVYDFVSTYVQMQQANWLFSDKYFHSKANYLASKRGIGGEYAAEKMSNLREITDKYFKGDSYQDCMDDQAANMYGRSMGEYYRYRYNPRSAGETVTKYRPLNLPSKY